MDCNLLKKRIEQLDEILGVGVAKGEKTGEKALVLDLANETSEDLEIPQQWKELYCGGPALGSRLWVEFSGPKVDEPDSYESDNPVVIVGPSEFGNSISISFVSPQTGKLVFNECLNSFGPKLRSCGYSAVVLCNRMRRLGSVSISKKGPAFSYIEKAAGLGTSETSSLFKTTCLVIGPAGENRVKFASCVCDGKATGRGGLGYVLGMKNIKAICVISNAMKKEDTVADQFIEKSITGKKLKETGSNVLIYNSIRSGWAPIENFHFRTDPRLFHLSGDETRRRLGDEGVMIGCGYAETLMLGSNIGCFDVEKVVGRYQQCIELGLDSISVGCILGWAFEASKKGIFSLPNDFDCKENEAVNKLIESISKRSGIGEKLSNGVLKLGEEFGGSEFAYQINGLECGPFDFRGDFTQALNSSLGNLFPVYPSFFSEMCKSDYAGWTILNEDYTMGLCSLGVDPVLLLCISGDMGFLKRYLARFVPVLKRLVFNLDKVFKTTGLDSFYIGTLGLRCRRILDAVNSTVGKESVYSIPDYFMVNPESNSKTTSIVPMHKLLDEYRIKRNRVFVRRDIASSQPEKQKSIVYRLVNRFFWC